MNLTPEGRIALSIDHSCYKHTLNDTARLKSTPFYSLSAALTARPTSTMAASEASTLLQALGQSSGSRHVASIVSSLPTADASPPSFVRKSIGPVSYHSIPMHGVSLQFEQSSLPSTRAPDSVGCRETLSTCQAIDVYNDNYDPRWRAYTALPLLLKWLPDKDDTNNALTFTLTKDTTGAQLVGELGEPNRKGGGEPLKGGGASGLGPGAWMEWTLSMLDAGNKSVAVNVMVELAGADVRGAGRWDKQRAGAARWGVCTFSLPS